MAKKRYLTDPAGYETDPLDPLGTRAAARKAQESAPQVAGFKPMSQRQGLTEANSPNDYYTSMSAPAADSGGSPTTAPSAGGGGGSNRTGSYQPDVAQAYYQDPTMGLINLFKEMGVYIDDSDPDPLSRIYLSVAGALPYLYDYTGVGEKGSADFPYFMNDYIDAWRTPQAQGGDYSNSALFDYNELSALVQSIIAGGGGSDPLMNAQYEAFRNLPADQAFQTFMALISGAGASGMTGLALNSVLSAIEKSWKSYQRDQVAAGNIGSGSENLESRFWTWLQGPGRQLLDTYF